MNLLVNVGNAQHASSHETWSASPIIRPVRMLSEFLVCSVCTGVNPFFCVLSCLCMLYIQSGNYSVRGFGSGLGWQQFPSGWSIQMTLGVFNVSCVDDCAPVVGIIIKSIWPEINWISLHFTNPLILYGFGGRPTRVEFNVRNMNAVEFCCDLHDFNHNY